jgi:homoserine O-succinyltransferase
MVRSNLEPRLRIGIINLMPRAELYEPYLLRPLTHADVPFEPHWIRLASHGYAQSDSRHIEERYRSFEAVQHSAALDGLIITGAPLEELEFSAVMCWRELAEILDFTRAHALPTLGLCWGGLALAWRLGLEKSHFPRKLFGVFELRRLGSAHPLLTESDDVFACPQSRHAGISDLLLERAVDDGRVRLLAHAEAPGYSIFESADGLYLMHLGHPEYDAARLIAEYRRDVAAARQDVRPPVDLDLDAPVTRWRSHRNEFFRHWLQRVRSAAGAGG